MDGWIALARGPLFRLSLAVCLLGLGYQLLDTLWMAWQAHRRAADQRLPLAAILAATARRLRSGRSGKPLQTAASVVFHAGILLVPLFGAGHVGLWRASVGVPWPTLRPGAADVLSLLTVAGLAALLLDRWLSSPRRQLTSAGDAGLLLLLLAVALSGYWAAHPVDSPLAPRTMVLLHMLAADLALLLTPLTKIAHCVLAPLNHLVSEVAWHFPAETGAHVALALGKEGDPL